MKKIKMKDFVILLIVLGTITMSSCRKKDLFEQPSIEVTGYTLLELPGEYTYLEIDMIVTNNDSREAQIKDVEYQVVIEGVTSELEEEVIDKEILVDTPLELTLPITLLTREAIQLLAKLDAGENLNYEVTGVFHVDEPILKLFDLPIDVQGTAFVEAGFEDFYEQPEVTVDDISGTFSDNGTTYTFDFDVTNTIENMDPRSVTIDEVEYIVFIEGIESETHLYSDSYSTDVTIAGNGTISLMLPVTLNLNSDEGEALANAIDDGTVDYAVEGIFHAVNVDGTAVDFFLPLYITGNTTVNLGDFFEQPTIEVTGYTLLELPGEYTYLDIDMIVTNNDTREAYITDVNYQVVIEGVTALPEQEDINQTLLAGTPLELTLPLTLLTNDAIELLTVLDAGEELEYTVTGTFHVDDPILNLFDFPVDITGTATVEVGFEDFYEQPETTVNDISGEYTINGYPVPTSYTFDFDVNCTVENMDTRDVVIDEVEYIVFIEGNESETHWYSDTYSTDISIAGGGTVLLTLPVTLNLSTAEGVALVAALTDGFADYIIEGTFHVIEVDGVTADFLLPLYDTGSVPVTLIAP